MHLRIASINDNINDNNNINDNDNRIIVPVTRTL